MEISEAYEILKDTKKRKVYDKAGSYGLYLLETKGEEAARVHIMRQSNSFKVAVCYCIATFHLLHYREAFIIGMGGIF